MGQHAYWRVSVRVVVCRDVEGAFGPRLVTSGGTRRRRAHEDLTLDLARFKHVLGQSAKDRNPGKPGTADRGLRVP